MHAHLHIMILTPPMNQLPVLQSTVISSLSYVAFALYLIAECGVSFHIPFFVGSATRVMWSDDDDRMRCEVDCEEGPDDLDHREARDTTLATRFDTLRRQRRGRVV